MKKQVLLFILALLPVVVSADYSGSCGTNVTYKYVSATKTLTISGFGKMTQNPWYSYCANIQQVLIEEGVTHISDHAFRGCTNLTSLSIPSSITSIGTNAFWECKNLTAVYICDLTSWCKIDYSSNVESNPLCHAHHLYVNGEEIKDLVIPESVPRINDCAFQGWKGLTSLTIPNSVTHIGSFAFSDCQNLTSVIIPNSVKSMGSVAFGNSLSSIIYTSPQPPRCLAYLGMSMYGWFVTTKTYVPDKKTYEIPDASTLPPVFKLKEDAQIIEMITFDEYEFEYTGQSPTTTWINNVEGYTATLEMPTLNSEIGNYEVWIPVTFTKDNESFTTNVVYRYRIKPFKLAAKVENASREYGEDNPQFKVSYSGFSDGDDESVITTHPTISTTATKTSDVGEYPITLSGGTATNYEIVYESGILTVTKAPLSAKVNDATKLYGSQNPAFTIEYNGLKNEETAPRWATSPTFQTEATRTSGVGQYVVNAVNGVPMNYELSGITSGTLSVTPAPLTIKADNAERQYYSENPDFSYICSGFVNGDDESVLTATPMLSTTANLSSNVGTYEIEVSEASASNYSISYGNGTLTITPRTLLASVGNYERPYNEENPEFEVKYFGFVENENESVLNENVIATTTATKTSDVGTYKIEMTGGNADNYIFSYSSGILTINKAEQTVLWEQDFSNLEIGDQVELVAVASSGLPVAFAIDDSSFAEIYTAGTKTYLDCKAKGETQIVAIQDGNKNYHSSSRVRKTVHIGDGSSSVNSVTGAVVKIRMISTGIRVDNVSVGEMIRVYTSDGVLLKNVKAESQSIEIPLTKNHLYFIKVGTKTFKFSY